MGSKSVIGQLFALGFIVWLVWILLAGEPHERLERSCKPVDWGRNLSVSGAALFAPSYQSRVTVFFENMDYSCQYMLWRLFYESDYKAALEQEAQEGVTSEPARRHDAPPKAPQVTSEPTP